LGEQREKLRTEYNSRRVVGEAEKMIEDKVAGALQGRANVGMHGVKDLLSFVKGNADMDDAAAKNYTRFSTLFGNETGTSNDALLGYSSSCKSMQKLHADLFSTLSSVELRRAEEALASFEDGAKKVSGACSTMVADLQSARERVEKAYQAQEKAWSDCEEADKHSSRVVTVDSDPWLAGLRYQTAVKALETVQKTHGSDLGRLCQEMKAHDLKRLETMKSVLRSYAEARRNLLAKALQNAEELCGMIEKIEPQQDSEGWLAAAEISDVELKQAEEKSSEAPPTISASSLGVWIPDEAVRQCNRCQMAFGIMRRKHHCRRCGHVFCDKCR
jgi:exonuclease VII small subunit